MLTISILWLCSGYVTLQPGFSTVILSQCNGGTLCDYDLISQLIIDFNIGQAKFRILYHMLTISQIFEKEKYMP